MSEEAHSEVREVQEIPPAKKPKLNDEQPTSSNTGEVEVDSIQDTADDKFGSEDSYGNFVTREELERLKEFKVLDEVKSNDEDSNDEESDSSDGLPEEEIEKMLEEDLPEDFKGAPKQKEKAYITRQKIVLEEKGVNHFEVLPLDWTMVRHVSGMPVYMHRATRVCTLSKPYFLGKGNTRRHEIPISAIPCYAYRRALEEEEKQKEIDKKIAEQIRAGTWVNTQPKTENNGNSQDSMDTSQPNMDSSQPSMDSSQPSDVTEPAPSCEVTIKEENNVKQEVQCPYMNGHASLENMTHENLNNGEATADSNEVLPVQKTEEIVEENPDTASKETEESVDQKPDVSVDSEIAGPSGEGTSQESTSNGDVQVPLNRQPVVLPGGIVMPPPRVETINTSWKTQHLTAEQINDYCKKLFKFKTVYIMHFKRWADRRKYTKARKTLQYPTLPEGTKLITIPAQPAASTDDNNAAGKASKRDWVMNMNGRSYLSVFHEYVRRALQKQPVYEFRQLENAATPYQATVYIGGMQYGVGHGSSKRQAKSAAARSSIHILIPEMRDQLEPTAQPDPEPDFTFFDYVGIEDPRITEFCAATFEPSPHAILRTCLLRNFGAGDRHIHTEMKKLEYQKIELTMKVGKHTATVVSKNKKTAKQRASQAILQALHPHVRSWGSLLRLYGSRSVKSCKEKKLEEQQITLLQDKARHNEPNYAVLDKLRNEMRKLRERDEAVVPIGTLLVHDDLPTHSGSNLNNVDL
ncbi:microprocessor complex subunit DGCR8 [Helicoverpa armigera]|uniref:microprocessor complex subunit DGCR8 n=1 Tax=Helicoverpa armigera TaxID=29058 RepID=UPI0030833940